MTDTAGHGPATHGPATHGPATHGAATDGLGTLTQAELEDQPAAWKTAAAMVPTIAGTVSAAQGRLAVVGCGTSYYMGGAYAELRERAGLGEADAFVASRVPPGRTYDVLLAISRSGTTRDLVEAMTATPPGTRRIALTGTPTSPVAEAADEVVGLSFADEKSVVQTRFATTGLAWLRGFLGTDLGTLAAEAEDALRAPLPEVGAYDHLVFLGSGWASWLAAEAALKLREMTCAMTESYLDAEYEHGPVSVASPGTLVWSLGPLAAPVRTSIERTGAHIVDSERDPMAELVRVHRYGVALARAKGIDCDTPRFLRRSVD
ncbi:SIS domain-containing protein [Actinopolymorpha sp. B11F2]|uniref:SIS domain-containing protein n=1 Tax=Actinopolymorpha sp. B11F2 TaxID=3160862 RepID=UPI0032E440FE